MEKINWCFQVKHGLKLIEPNLNVSNSYLIQSEKTLSKVKRLIDEEDYLWASVRIYYCAYYCIYSFLQKVGIKSENHDCSIELIKFLLNEEFVKDIDIFRASRIDSQYYLILGQKEKLLENYQKVKEFYLNFKEKIDALGKKEITNFRIKIEGALK